MFSTWVFFIEMAYSIVIGIIGKYLIKCFKFSENKYRVKYQEKKLTIEITLVLKYLGVVL